ncbi:MAG: hypothetical protein AABW85_05840, partial [archaeon]
MTKFFSILSDSFNLLAREPKLFLPKIFVSFLYSIPVIFLPALAVASFAAPSPELLGSLVFWLVFTFAALIVDSVVSAMYPFLVKDFFEKKQVSLRAALDCSLKKSFLVVPTALLVELLFVAFVVVLSFPMVFFILTNNVVGELAVVLVALAAIFLFAVFFFLIYPVMSLEKNGVVSSIKRSFFLSRKNFFGASKAAAFSFVLSISSFALAFALDFFSGKGLLA